MKTIASWGLVAASFLTLGTASAYESMGEEESRWINESLTAFQRYVQWKENSDSDTSWLISDRTIDDIFQPLPGPFDGNKGTDSKTPGDFFPDFPSTPSSRKSGAADLIALETLYQTLVFYGVKHYVTNENGKLQFNVLFSHHGYFQHLKALDVSFALKEFSKFIVAHLCNEPTLMNFNRAFGQVSEAEIGLRFKGEMAWALLGNELPKQPNALYKLGTQWKILQDTFKKTSFDKEASSSAEFKTWLTAMTDIMNIVTGLSKLSCYIDIRPKPREQLVLNRVIKKLLRMQVEIYDRYDSIREAWESARTAGEKAQIESLRQTP